MTEPRANMTTSQEPQQTKTMAEAPYPYRYRCIDKSILLPYFKKYYVAFFFRYVPPWLTANFITLISTAFIFGLLVVELVCPDLSPTAKAAVIAFALHAYLVGDHLDGMQAKATGTSSPLGEFLDHYLDVYNGAIVFLVLVAFFNPVAPIWFYGLLWLNCLAFAATMMEELERQELYFNYLGTLEGVLLLIVFFLSWLIPSVREFWQWRVFGDYPLFSFILPALGLGYLGTIIDILRRLRYSPWPFTLYSLCSLLLVWFLYQNAVNPVKAWLIVVLYSGEYIGKVMGSYLLVRRHRYPDLAASAIILLLTIGVWWQPTFFGPKGWLDGLAIYLGLRVAWVFIHNFRQLQAHWHWLNP